MAKEIKSGKKLDVHLDDSTMARARADFAALESLAISNTTVRTMLVSAGRDVSRIDTDGPCGIYKWRHNGIVIDGMMQKAAWQMVNHLWQQPDYAASFDDLKIPVYDDYEHIAENNAFGSLRRAANNYFRKHGIPWTVSIKKTAVSLHPKK